MSKRALCVGINDYPGTQYDLRGCVNDAHAWSKLLRSTYGFRDRDTVVLTDREATPSRIKEALEELVDYTKPGDVAVFTYSGHGSYTPDRDGDEPDRRDETLAVYRGHIVDDEIREITRKLDQEGHLTVISDSCHSGTVTRAMVTREVEAMRVLEDASEESEVVYLPRPRFLPPEYLDEDVTSRSYDTRGRVFFPEASMPEVLLTGCRDTESSYDAYLGGRYHGALTFYALRLIKARPKQTYRQLHAKLREILPNASLPQSPQLEGPRKLKDAPLFTNPGLAGGVVDDDDESPSGDVAAEQELEQIISDFLDSLRRRRKRAAKKK